METITIKKEDYDKLMDMQTMTKESKMEKELLASAEPYECYCSECGNTLDKPDPNMTDEEFEEWFDEAGGTGIMCRPCGMDARTQGW